MILIEFEKSDNGDTSVRIVDPTAPPPGIMAERLYHGQPPGLLFDNADVSCVVLRLDNAPK